MGLRVVLLRRRTLGAALAVAAGLTLTAGFGWSWTPAAPADPGRPVMIEPGGPVMIDPGHGGVDGGAAAGGLVEKEITLDVGLRLRQYLEDLGIPVQMTRETDTDLGGGPGSPPGRHRRDLEQRVTRTRAAGAGLLVSLHVNSSRNSAEEGMLFFYARDLPAGRALAQQVSRALQRLHPRREPPVGRSNLYVLRASGIPAVLIEMGFISHAAERARLADPDYRDRMARSLAVAIAAFYGSNRGG